MGPTTSGFRPDNSEHTYCWQPSYTGTNPIDAGHRAMRTVLGEQTTMFSNQVGNCNQYTDAKFHKLNLPAGTDGTYQCLEQNGNACEDARLEFDGGAITSLDDWKQTTCHEVGHSVGLTHGDWDCLGNYHGDYRHRRWGDHHVYHVNVDR